MPPERAYVVVGDGVIVGGSAPMEAFTELQTVVLA